MKTPQSSILRSKILPKIRDWLVQTKIYISRATSYLSIINSGMILILLLTSLQAKGININIQKWGIPLFLTTITLLTLAGWLEQHLGLHTLEVTKINKQNKELQRLLENANKGKYPEPQIKGRPQGAQQK